ncbi:MAG: hypothetical protein ACFE95_14290 [Candidatus Hodarchaeota archaeon]
MDIKTSVRPCWKCKQITTIIDTNIRFLTNKYFGEEIRKKYPFFYLDFSKEAEEGYYMNHCEHCGEKQGENYLFIERLLETHEKQVSTDKRLREELLATSKKKEELFIKTRQTTLDEYFKL